MLVNSTLNEKPTFALMPISKDCPYVEGIYDPTERMLAIIGTSKKECFALLHALDENGKAIPIKKSGEYKEERLKVEKFQEYYLSDKNDIMNFLTRFAENSAEFNVEQFIN